MHPLISVIVATRDRPQLFEEALASVVGQQFANFEIVVVNDGSAPETLPIYQAVWDNTALALGPRFAVHSLVHRPRGHGSSYSLNFGASQARGDYLCFLDDDDKWTDPFHLSACAQAISAAADQGQVIDLYMANQEAGTSDGAQLGKLWLGTLAAELVAHRRAPDARGHYPVTVADLMATTGFCHLNCLTVRRALFEQVGGLDEGIRWENDRDLYLKLIEASRHMLHNPKVISWHRVPDPTKTVNMTTALAMVEKRLLQTLVLDRAVVRSQNPDIQQHAKRHKGYALKRIAQDFADKGDWAKASFYARQALGAAPGLKWLAFTLQCGWRSLSATRPGRLRA